MNNLNLQISNTFDIRKDLIEKVKDEQELINLLSLFIQELIDKDFEQLLFLLYKIDLGENKVKKAILDSPADKAHIVIAEMIIEREKEKIETRKKYKSDTKETDWIF